MNLKSFSPPATKRKGTRQFKALIQITPKSAFFWPVIVPMPAGFPDRTIRTALPSQALACRIVLQLTTELTAVLHPRQPMGSDWRSTRAQIQQIAMYTCHVVLRMSLSDIAEAFGKHRTTVSHACHVVEDRRDNAAFELFVDMIERIVLSVFSPEEAYYHA